MHIHWSKKRRSRSFGWSDILYICLFGLYKKKITFLINQSLAEFYDCYDVHYLVPPIVIPANDNDSCLYVCSVKSYIYPLDPLWSQFKNILTYDLTDSLIETPLYRHILEVLTGDVKVSGSDQKSICFTLAETRDSLDKFDLADIVSRLLES